MCRWLGYLGKPITLHKFLYEEEYSLIGQSYCARKAKTVVNGDGFGFGWYGDAPVPGRFRDILPAWSDENLLSLARLIKSGLFMVHVRAATDTTTGRSNCHPFTHDRSMFVHNGQVGGYLSIRRKLESLIPDAFYTDRLGSTDSEILFLFLESLLIDYPFHAAIQRLIETVEKLMSHAHIKKPFRFTSAYSNGKQLSVVRYSSDKKAPSLSYNYEQDGWIVVSEPLDSAKARWRTVPRNHTMIIEHGMIEPVITPI